MSKRLPRRPWKGRNYSGLLIVAESLHGFKPEADDEDLLIKVIDEIAAGSWTHRFWTNVALVVTGRCLRDLDRQSFWQEVAFHDFVQSSMSGPGIPPSREQWTEGCRTFPTVLQQLKPHHVLVVSQRVFSHMPASDAPDLPPISANGCDGWPRLYSIGGESFALAMAINHVSRISPPKWHPLVRAFQETSGRPVPTMAPS